MVVGQRPTARMQQVRNVVYLWTPCISIVLMLETFEQAKSAEVMPYSCQGGRPARHVECKATAAYRSADLTEPQHTAASRSRQRHTKAQAAVYSKPAAVQEFRQPPELPIYLVSNLASYYYCTGQPGSVLASFPSICNSAFDIISVLFSMEMWCLGRGWSASQQRCLASMRIQG